VIRREGLTTSRTGEIFRTTYWLLLENFNASDDASPGRLHDIRSRLHYPGPVVRVHSAEVNRSTDSAVFVLAVFISFVKLGQTMTSENLSLPNRLGRSESTPAIRDDAQLMLRSGATKKKVGALKFRMWNSYFIPISRRNVRKCPILNSSSVIWTSIIS
jgi:hypothetical protein